MPRDKRGHGDRDDSVTSKRVLISMRRGILGAWRGRNDLGGLNRTWLVDLTGVPDRQRRGSYFELGRPQPS